MGRSVKHVAHNLQKAIEDGKKRHKALDKELTQIPPSDPQHTRLKKKKLSVKDEIAASEAAYAHLQAQSAGTSVAA